MYHELHKSFDYNLSRFHDWQRLSEHKSNRCRKDDFTEAAIVAGKLELIASILTKEWDDTSRNDEAADAIQWARETGSCIL